MFYIYRCVEQNPLFLFFELFEQHIGFGARLDAENYIRCYLKLSPGARGLHVVCLPGGGIPPKQHFEWSN